MSILDIFKRKSSANTAKERLMMVLSIERKNLPPNFTEILKDDLISLFSKYPQFDSGKIDVELKRNGEREELWISIPFVKGNR